VPQLLLIVLYCLIIIGIIIIIVISRAADSRSTGGAYTKSGKLIRSQRDIGVRYGRVDRLLRKLNKRVIPLTMNNLLSPMKNVDATLHRSRILAQD
jgi:hypothetical protein